MMTMRMMIIEYVTDVYEHDMCMKSMMIGCWRWWWCSWSLHKNEDDILSIMVWTDENEVYNI